MFPVLFIVEFAFLFLLSKYLIKSLSRLFFKISKNEKTTITMLAYLFLPGTVIHELSHLLAAGLLFVGAGNMQLTPKVTEDGIRLGSVEIEKKDLFRRAIIGVAPVLVGFAIIFGAIFYLQSLNSPNLLTYLVSIFIIFEVGNTLFSSKKDLEGTLELLITSLVLGVALFVIKPEIMRNVFAIFQKSEVTTFFKNADLFLLAPMLIDLIFILITRIFIREKS